MSSSVVRVGSVGAVPQKIIIKGTSKLSLQDRFARLSSEVEQQRSTFHTNDVAVSAANKRLAQDLGNHPDVVAALHMQRKSVLQRLGVKARLGVPAGFQQRGFQQRNGFRPFQNRFRNIGTSPIGHFNNGYFNPRNFGPKRMNNNSRGGSLSGMGFGRGGFRKRFSRGGGRGGWRYGRGGGRGGGMQNERLSREELDRQLDEYMAKTKTHLDNDLDVYMGETVIG